MRNFFRNLFRRSNPVEYYPHHKITLVREYLDNAIVSFEIDPASSKYQQGYLAALKNTRAYVQSLD